MYLQISAGIVPETQRVFLYSCSHAREVTGSVSVKAVL